MAAPSVDTGFGTTVAFGTSTTLNSLQLTDINWAPGDRPVIETTHYSTSAPGATQIGNATFIASDVFDNGVMTFEYHFNPDVVVPSCAAAETVTITWAGNSGTWVFSGIVMPTSGAMPLKDRMVLTIDVKVAGAITVTAAS